MPRPRQPNYVRRQKPQAGTDLGDTTTCLQLLLATVSYLNNPTLFPNIDCVVHSDLYVRHYSVHVSFLSGVQSRHVNVATCWTLCIASSARCHLVLVRIICCQRIQHRARSSEISLRTLRIPRIISRQVCAATLPDQGPPPPLLRMSRCRLT